MLRAASGAALVVAARRAATASASVRGRGPTNPAMIRSASSRSIGNPSAASSAHNSSAADSARAVATAWNRSAVDRWPSCKVAACAASPAQRARRCGCSAQLPSTQSGRRYPSGRTGCSGSPISGSAWVNRSSGRDTGIVSSGRSHRVAHTNAGSACQPPASRRCTTAMSHTHRSAGQRRRASLRSRSTTTPIAGAGQSRCAQPRRQDRRRRPRARCRPDPRGPTRPRLRSPPRPAHRGPHRHDEATPQRRHRVPRSAPCHATPPFRGDANNGRDTRRMPSGSAGLRTCRCAVRGAVPCPGRLLFGVPARSRHRERTIGRFVRLSEVGQGTLPLCLRGDDAELAEAAHDTDLLS